MGTRREGERELFPVAGMELGPFQREQPEESEVNGTLRRTEPGNSKLGL